jgi:hypothetical protein
MYWCRDGVCDSVCVCVDYCDWMTHSTTGVYPALPYVNLLFRSFVDVRSEARTREHILSAYMLEG